MERARRRLALVSVGAFSAVLSVVGTVPALAAGQTISFTSQGCRVWNVPTGVSGVQIRATGSAGANSASPGGSGDVVAATLSGLRNGDALTVCVGIGGGPRPQGGYNVGGVGGGAASVGLYPKNGLHRLILVGAGGGGGGTFTGTAGGNAGYPAGAPGGATLTGGDLAGGGGGGGTQTSGGAGGRKGESDDLVLCTVDFGLPCTAGGPGSAYTTDAPIGGIGGYGPAVGGGGGAGYFGGGGGGGGYFFSGGGGGGSDYCVPSIALPALVSGCRRIGPNAAFGTGSVVLTTL